MERVREGEKGEKVYNPMCWFILQHPPEAGAKHSSQIAHVGGGSQITGNLTLPPTVCTGGMLVRDLKPEPGTYLSYSNTKHIFNYQTNQSSELVIEFHFLRHFRSNCYIFMLHNFNKNSGFFFISVWISRKVLVNLYQKLAGFGFLLIIVNMCGFHTTQI